VRRWIFRVIRYRSIQRFQRGVGIVSADRFLGLGEVIALEGLDRSGTFGRRESKQGGNRERVTEFHVQRAQRSRCGGTRSSARTCGKKVPTNF
jgi:hypothetical protein